jgi:hypothetical protein
MQSPLLSAMSSTRGGQSRSPGRTLETAAARVVMTRWLVNDEIIVERSALRDLSRQRNVANQSGFDSRA